MTSDIPDQRSADRSADVVLAQARRVAADIRRRAERDAAALRREAAEWASSTRRDAERLRFVALADIDRSPVVADVDHGRPAAEEPAPGPGVETDTGTGTTTDTATTLDDAGMVAEHDGVTPGTVVVVDRPVDARGRDTLVDDAVRTAVRRVFDRMAT